MTFESSQTSQRIPRFLIRTLVASLALMGSISAAQADIVVTRDEIQHQGRITISSREGIQVTTSNSVTTIALPDFKQVRITATSTNNPEPSIATLLSNQFANRFVAVPRAGLLTWNGSFIAAKVQSLDDTRILLEKPHDGLTLTRVNTTAIFFQPLSLHHAHRLRHAKPGVLLHNGDFVEGRIRSLENRRVTLASLLFGLRSYDTDKEAVALWLQDPLPQITRYSIQTAAGSRFLVPELELEQNTIILNSSPFQNYRLPLDQELEINQQPGTNILELAWARLDAASPDDQEALLARIEIPDLEKEAAEANLVRARNIWDETRRVWTNKNRDYNQAKGEAARAISQAQARQRQIEPAKRSLEKATRDLKTKQESALEADNALQAARLELNKTQDDQARKSIEERIRNATRTRDTAHRNLSRAQSQLKRANSKHKEALEASQQATAQAERLAQIEAIARKELEQAQKETETAKQAFDLAMTRLL